MKIKDYFEDSGYKYHKNYVLKKKIDKLHNYSELINSETTLKQVFNPVDIKFSLLVYFKNVCECVLYFLNESGKYTPLFNFSVYEQLNECQGAEIR